jgi:hypothetical protein
MGLGDATYRHDYRVNDRAKELLIKAINESRTDVHGSYDLYRITDLLEFHCVPYRLERYGIGTTGEIQKAIKYLVDTNQI